MFSAHVRALFSLLQLHTPVLSLYQQWPSASPLSSRDKPLIPVSAYRFHSIQLLARRLPMLLLFACLLALGFADASVCGGGVCSFSVVSQFAADTRRLAAKTESNLAGSAFYRMLNKSSRCRC